jgi:SAM-dependent methyltransferase
MDRYVQPRHRVLDVGAGAGHMSPYNLRGRVAEIVGVDLDPRVVDNPLLDRGVVADAGRLPFEDASFDVAFSIYVLEHISDPAGFAREIARVLEPGGIYLALTPSRYHYVSMISAVTPMWFHIWYNEAMGSSGADHFPTHYLLNTHGAIERAFGPTRMALEAFDCFEVSPHYLKFSTLAFLIGVAYERIVSSSERFAPLRVNVAFAMRKSA